MSWTDVGFSWNQRKQYEMSVLRGKLYSLVDNCFVATNMLIDCIQKYLPGRKFDKLQKDTPNSILDNCDLIIQRLGEIETYLEGKKKDVEKKMKPELFKKLVSTDTSHNEKMKIAKMSSTTIIEIAGSVEGVFLCGAINAENVFANITRALGVLKTRVVPTVSYGSSDSWWTSWWTSFWVILLCRFLWKIIVCLFTRATKRDQQEDALNNYYSVVQEFQGAVEEFVENISLVKAMIEVTA